MLYRWLDHMASVVGLYEVLYDGWLNHIVRFFLFFFRIPFTIFALLFLSLLLIVVTQIRGHMAGSFPSSLRFVPCIFIERRFELFLPSSTRVELCLPTLEAISAVGPFSLFFCK